MEKKLLILTLFFGLAVLSGCSTDSDPVAAISTPQLQIGQQITTDTLSGAIKGTLISGKTYYFKTDITINSGDTLLFQQGSKLIAIGDGLTAVSSPQISVNGVLISLGTKDQPVWITIPDTKKATRDGMWAGSWGGIQCSPTCPLLVVKWTHIEAAGGPAGAIPPYGMTQGDPRYLINFANNDGVFVLEDSWLTGSKDDGVRVSGGKIAIFRNTWEMCGQASGDNLNIKSGTVGDIGYNVFLGGATNGIKHSNSGNTTIQANVYVFNNNFINCGMRQIQTGRGGSFNIEKGAKGNFYNNIIVNCRFGIRETKDADTVNFKYGNTLYFGNAISIVNEFLAITPGSVSKFQSSDIVNSTNAKQNDPSFVNYDLNKYDLSAWTFPISATAQADDFLKQGTWDFHLKTTSPAVGKGKIDFSAMSVAVVTNSAFAPAVLNPGKDLGAYQADGSGNKH